MTDTLDPTLPPPPSGGDRIEPVDIQQEMQRSYIDYAMSPSSTSGNARPTITLIA